MIPGAILQIKIKNFMTYDKLKFVPIEYINIINGPNGTGKSSILCAIIIGLGGNAAVAGRAKSLSQYIKTGCDVSKIEIVLYDPDRNHTTIMRVIEKNTSTWFLNGKQASQKSIDQTLKIYNIQPDNLCQVLPQEKIETFAKMNDKERLRNTLKTIGDIKLYDTFVKLKDSSAVETQFETELTELNAELEENKRDVDRLDVIVKSIAERRALIDKVSLLRQRLAWQKYVKAFTWYRELKSGFSVHIKEYRTASKKVHNMKKELSLINAKLKLNENKYSVANNSAQEVATRLNFKIYDISNKTEDINALSKEMEEKEKNVKQCKNDIKLVEEEITTLQSEMPDTKSLDNNLKLITAEREVLSHKLDNITEEKVEKEGAVRRHSNNLQGIKQKIAVLEDASKNKLNILQKKYPDLIKAVNWLEQNTDKFEKRVYPPIVLEINITDPANAKYVEHIIPERDLVAFLCEDDADATLLLTNLKDRLKLKVNVVTAPSNCPSSFQPKVPIQNLTSYGFKQYLLDMIDAPELIIRYLAHSFNLHNIPIGNERTFAIADSVPNTIRTFFSDKHRFNLITSSYTGNTIMRSVEVRGSYLLDSVNKSRITELYVKKDEYNKLVNGIMEDISRLDNENKHLQLKIHELDIKKKGLIKKQRAHAALQLTYERKLRDLDHLKSIVGVNIEEQKIKIEKKINDHLLEILQMHSQLEPDLELHSASSIEPQVLQLFYNHLKEIKHRKIKQIQKFEESAKKVMKKYRKCEKIGKRQKRLMNELYARALDMTGGQLPNKRNWNNFDEFVKLSKKPSVLQEMILECEAKLRCGSEQYDSEAIMEEYEQKKRKVTKLEGKISNKAGEKAAFVEEMTNLKHSLLPKIERLISEINIRFAKLFSDMNCVSEVVLYKGINENNYDEYGIHIKVKFREELNLQILDSLVQSGGERTLSIAIYLLSLQDLSCVPFRCIDEINQGLDELNENRIFNLLAHIGSKEGAPQYFLLTPKLPTRLNTNAKMQFSFTINGDTISDSFKFSMKKIKEYLIENNSSDETENQNDNDME